MTDVEAVADAFVWGLPLVVMHRTRARHGPAAAGVLVARDRLSTPADRSVVAPNNDTLYASGWFDLRAGDLHVEVEPLRRYWSIMLLDAYTHVGYVSRRLYGTGADVRVVLDPATRLDPDTAPKRLPIATPTAWVLVRVLVDGPDDLVDARAALDRVHVRQPGASDRRGADAALPSDHGRPERFVTELRDALAMDPPAPWHPPPPVGLDRLLHEPPPADDVADGVRAGEARLGAHGLGADRSANGWRTRSRGADFGDDVTYRAVFARVSLAGHLPAENRSYSRPFDGREAAELRFPPGGEPPVDGFWSLTCYGPDLFLVDNELGRSSIGDRTPGLRRDRDGGLTITVGDERPAAAAAAANWLPTPPGRCFLVLRAYEGAPAVVAADWFPPDLIAAS